jgi:proline iminopeptidase
MRIILLLLIILPTGLFAQNTEDHSGYIESNGLRIFYQTFGSGDPLLIINGGPGMSSEGFIPLAKELATDRQTIIFDQRGTGKSSLSNPNNDNITMDLMIEDMENLRNHLQIEQWSMLGHSFGGMLAAYYTSKLPDRVTALIFSSSGGVDMDLFDYISITGRLTQLQRDSLQYRNNQIAGGDTSYHARLRRGVQLAPAYLYHKKYVPVIANRLTQGNLRVNTLVFQDLRKIEFDSKPQLSNYQGKTLIIQGAEDIIGMRTATRAKEVLPQAQIVLLEKCGHYGWLDQKEKYFSTINGFLKQI